MAIKIKKKLLDILIDKIRFKHYSYSTEKTYYFIIGVRNICYFTTKGILWRWERESEIEEFLTYLATKEKVSIRLLNGILFMYKEILGIDITFWNIQAYRTKEPKRIPVILYYYFYIGILPLINLTSSIIQGNI